MKIGIFTFHCAQNYGAVLQAYGLQEYLRSQGYDVYIIDYCPKYLLEPYKILNIKKIVKNRNLKLFIREFLTIPIRLKRTLVFNKFVKQRLRLYKLDLYEESNDFDAFVFGSDQIWNPSLTRGFDDVYFGKFPAAKGKLLISYAASAGNVSQLTEIDKKYLKDALKDFSYISVRERDFKSLLENEIKVRATCVSDPVLLAGIDVYNSLVYHRHLKKGNDYLLLFQLEVINDLIRPFAMKVANSLGKELIEVLSRGESMDMSIRQSLSPEAFLHYIKESSYVITTSFHGTIFSILFNKPFSTIKVNDYIDARAGDLLAKLGVKSRLVNIECSEIKDMLDRSTVQQGELELYVKESRVFLLNSLSL